MKKRGKRIRQTACCRPLGAKTTAFELNARISLVALQSDIATQDHMVNFYVLADIVERIGGAAYALSHAATIKRLCNEILRHEDGIYRAVGLQYQSMMASVDVLIKFFHAQKNADIHRAALAGMEELV